MTAPTFCDNSDNRLVDHDDDQQHQPHVHEDQQRHAAAVMVRSNYSLETDSYETNCVSNPAIEGQEGPLAARATTNTSVEYYIRRKSSNLAQYISHAFATGAKTNYLFGYLLFFNLLMSIFNTVLLSFIVKSVQLNDFAYQLASGKSAPPASILTWNEHLEATVLDLPASLIGDKSVLSVQSIESGDGTPLIVQANHFVHPKHGQPQPEPLDRPANQVQTEHLRRVNEQAGSGDAGQQDDEESRLTNSGDGQILISARTNYGNSNNINNDGNNNGGADKSSLWADKIKSGASADHELAAARQRISYIIVDSAAGAKNGKPENGPRSGESVGGRPVEIVTDNLVLSSLVADNGQLDEGCGGGSQVDANDASSDDLSPGNRRLGAAPPVGSLAGRRRCLLQFDGERQLIVLPSARQLGLSPVGATTLLVADEFRCRTAISGTLNDDLDIQARQGNLTCASGDLLRLVSRSAKVNLLSGQSLTVSAAQLSLSAPRTNKVYLADGLEYLDSDRQSGGQSSSGQRDRAASGAAAKSSATTPNVSQLAGNLKLRAYNLLLIDNFLMASTDEPDR